MTAISPCSCKSHDYERRLLHSSKSASNNRANRAKLYREREPKFSTEIIQTLAAAICSVVWDFIVVYYHITTHPHPKFRLRLARRLSIYTHIFAGCTEILCSVLSFILYDEGLGNDSLRMRITYMTVICSFVHTLTGAFQTPQVFGTQCVMVPACEIDGDALSICRAVRLANPKVSPLQTAWLSCGRRCAPRGWCWTPSLSPSSSRCSSCTTFTSGAAPL